MTQNTISDLANVEAVSVKSASKLGGLKTFGTACGAGVVAVFAVEGITLGCRKLFGLEKKAAEAKAKAQAEADNRLRQIMNESSDRMIAGMAAIIAGQTPAPTPAAKAKP